MFEDIEVGDKFIYNGSFLLIYKDFTVGEEYTVARILTRSLEFVDDEGDLVSWVPDSTSHKNIFTSVKDGEVGDYYDYSKMSEKDFRSQIDYALDERDEELFSTLVTEAKKRGLLK